MRGETGQVVGQRDREGGTVLEPSGRTGPGPWLRQAANRVRGTRNVPEQGRAGGVPHDTASLRPGVPGLRKTVPPTARPAFTLTELIVSIAVLALMMTMAGTVFHLTLKSTGEAKALTTVNQRLRAFEGTLRADLRGVRPEESVLVIVPAKMNAYWSAAGRDADIDQDPSNGYAHPEDRDREVYDSNQKEYRLVEPRADVLMFVTSRPGTSTVDPSISAGLQTVVYGHAILGEWDKNTAANAAPWAWRGQYGEKESANERRKRFANATLKPATPPDAWEPRTGFGSVFPTPAQDWHLARRSTLLVEYDGSNPPAYLDKANAKYSPAVAFELDDCQPGNPASDPWTCKVSGDIPGTGTQKEKVRLALAEGRQDVVAYPTLDLGGTKFQYAAPRDESIPDMVYNLGHQSDQKEVEEYPAWYARAELDLTPPARIADRLGPYLLAHCASFKVEFAVDLPGLRGFGDVLWIDPADLVSGVSGVENWNAPSLAKDKWTPTRARIERMKQRLEAGEFGLLDAPLASSMSDALQRLLSDGGLTGGTDPAPRVTLDPATKDGPMVRWYGKAPDGASPDPLYPTALRVTVEVYDDEHRFERPTRHVMVFEIGS
jgi:prepilin-type N-terminal cleavage/methylation domain-containing protein